jgi:hypothetical protein
MVVADLDVKDIAILESKADPPLIVDGDRVLPLSVVGQRMKAVTRGHLQIG